MTTLIDRILSQIIPAFVDYNLRTKKHIIEYGDTPETFQLAEDRLNIEKQLEYNLRQILEAELTAVNGVDELIEKKLEEWDNRKPTDYLNVPGLLINIAKNDLKALKQTQVKDSQPKVVEIKDTGVNSFKCKCDNIVEYYNKYCGRCGAKIKWIA